MEIKIFTKDMLSVLWGKIKTLVSTSIAALSEVYSPLGHKHTTAEITDLAEATQGKSGLMSAADKTKIDGIAEKAQVNVVEAIKVNGSKLTPDTLKDVDIPVPTKTSDIVNDSNFAVDADYVHTDNNYTSDEKSKLEGVAAGAQVNVIEQVSVNGTPVSVTEKGVNIPVPTDNATLANGANYQNETQVDNKIKAAISTVYKPAGSSTFANLPIASNDNLGYVYNVTDSFQTTASFIEGEGKSYPAGTNVVVVANGDSFAYDILMGFVDLSPYQKSADLVAITEAEINEICV